MGLIPGSGRSPGRGHAIPFNILAWRIPWTEEAGGLQPIGSQRVGHDWRNVAWEHTYYFPHPWVKSTYMYIYTDT